MAKIVNRPQSRYSRNAVLLLGRLIRQARLERKMSAGELAERVGVSRGLIQRIEKGDPGSNIGAVFEAAALVGIRLFETDRDTVSGALAANTKILTLLPKTARTPKTKPKDEF